MTKKGYVYILTNKNNTVLYVGATSDLLGRIWQHKTKYYPKSFSARYELIKLVYYERLPTIGDANEREKQLKGGNRARKEKLINELNPEWVDLYEEILENEF